MTTDGGARKLATRALLAGALLVLAGVASLGAASSAHAAWSPAQLVSVDSARLEQGDGSTRGVDISADGRWVVFQTQATNFFDDGDPDPPGVIRQGGVFRFDRLTGDIQLVADGDQDDEDTGDLVLRGAANPSISDDGRWVVFQTDQRLAPQDDNDNADVYVRDMSVPLSGDRAAGGAFQLVSALDGTDTPPTYATRTPSLPGANPGTAVWTGQAISGDGRYVAFRTDELASSLPSGGDTTPTPAGNVFVRDLQAKRTVLVTPTLDGSGAAGGALPPVVLSRDGSTVAWVGGNGPEQTKMVRGESRDDGQAYYLWRRWNDSGATTRRVTGLADPDDRACAADGAVSGVQSATGPCYGPLADVDSGFRDISSDAPALSADGWTVAFLSGAAPRPAVSPDNFLDAYIASMRPGLSRKAATRVITQGTASGSNALANGDIESIALSADASRLVVVTSRRQFIDPAPPLVGDPRSSSGSSELYTLDLGPGGRTRRVLTPGGQDLNGRVDANPAISADGSSVAFTSPATNLVFGDANEQDDAFVVSEVPDPQTAPPPAGLGDDDIDEDVTSTDDSFTVRATAQPNGTVRLRVATPAAGALSAVAVTRPPARRARARRASRARSKPRAKRSAAFRARKLASARGRATRRSTVTLVLKLKAHDLATLRTGRALPARVTVTLTPSGRAKVRRASAIVTFKLVRKARKPTHSASRPARKSTKPDGR
ncbi:MAG TPA: hypothetical protein VGM91_01910 [Conexibacter sp.]